MRAESPRMTGPTIRIIGELMTAPAKGTSGAELSKVTKIPSGTMYPVLFRLEKAGWLESEWEDRDPSEMGRPRRRLYTITAKGAQKSRATFKELFPESGRIAWQS